MQKVRLLLVVFALTGVVLVMAPVIEGQYTYDVSHTFAFTPNGGVTALPTYVFGTSTFALPGGAPDVNNGSFIFGLGGGTSSWSATSTGPFSTATAHSSATLSPFTLGGPVSGVYTSDGSANAVPGGICCAKSSAELRLPGGRLNAIGNVVVIPGLNFMDNVDRNWGAGNAADPIDFQVTDLKTGSVTRGSLYSVSTDMFGFGPGSFSWAGGTFALNARNFDFTIDIDSPYTVQQGSADLQVRNGVITVSTGTGMFAGIFPSVGSPGTFTVPFDNNFSLDYNLGNFNGDPLDVQFMLSNGGSACLTPEVSSILLLGTGVIGLAGALRRRLEV